MWASAVLVHRPFIFVNSLPEFFSGVQAPGQGCLPYLVLYSQYFCVPGTYELSVQYWCLSEWPQSSEIQKLGGGSSLAWVATLKEIKTWIVTLKTKLKKYPPKKSRSKAWIVTLKTKPNQKTPQNKKHQNTVITTGDLKWWDCSAKERWPLIWDRSLESCRRLRRWGKEGTNYWWEKKAIWLESEKGS